VIVRQEPQFVVDLRALFVDRDELLVQVVEGRPRRAQPVLEDGDVRRVGLRRLDLGERAHREGEVRAVLVGVRFPPTRVRRRSRAVDDVPAGDDDVVGPAEEVEGRLLEGGLHARRALADLGEGREVRATDGVGEILLRPLDDGRRLAEAVVLTPVLRRHDLEEVAEPAELRGRGIHVARGDATQFGEVRAHEPRLLRRRLQVAVGAERAQPPILAGLQRRTCSRGSATGRWARPGTVHTRVPVRGRSA
jgi:hypothetical protein